MTSRRATLALGLVLVGLVVLFAIPGNGVLDTGRNRVFGTVLSHLAMLTLLWGAAPALRRAVARLDGVAGAMLGYALALLIVAPVVVVTVVRLAAPRATHQLLTREWGVVEPLQFALYVTAFWLCLAIRRQLGSEDRARAIYRAGAIGTAILLLEEIDYLAVLNLLVIGAGASSGRLGRKHIGGLHDVIDAWTQQTGLVIVAAIVTLAVLAAILAVWVGLRGYRAALRHEAGRPSAALLALFVAAVVTAQLIDIDDRVLTGGGRDIGMLEEPLELAAALVLNAALIVRLREAQRESRS